MTRGPGWRFLDMGRRLERAVQATARSCEARSSTPAADEDPVFEALLEIADSSMTYRNRYLTNLQLPPLLDLLDDRRDEPALDRVSGRGPERPRRSPAARRLAIAAWPASSGSSLACLTELRLADVYALAQVDGTGERIALDHFLDRTSEQLPDAVGRSHQALPDSCRPAAADRRDSAWSNLIIVAMKYKVTHTTIYNYTETGADLPQRGAPDAARSSPADVSLAPPANSARTGPASIRGSITSATTPARSRFRRGTIGCRSPPTARCEVAAPEIPDPGSDASLGRDSRSLCPRPAAVVARGAAVRL